MPNPCSTCAQPARVQWKRRPTPEELATERQRITQWREEKLRDGLVLPHHDFGPLPEATDVDIAVFACGDHAVHIDLAGRIHAADCSAPHPDHLPGCNCEPEPEPEPLPEPAMVTLSTGWTIPAAT